RPERHGQRPGVEVREVVRGQDETSALREIFDTFGPESKQDFEKRHGDRADEQIEGARPHAAKYLHLAVLGRLAMVFFVPKTLVIAEKPSVGRDLAGALDGPFLRRKLEDIKPKRGKKKVEETPEEVVEEATSK